jgi:hypothetical protein
MRHPVLRASTEIRIRNESASALIKEGDVSVSNFVTLIHSMIHDDSDTDSANESGIYVN